MTSASGHFAKLTGRGASGAGLGGGSAPPRPAPARSLLLYSPPPLAFLLFFPAVLAPTSALRKMAADSEVRCLPPTYRCLCLS